MPQSAPRPAPSPPAPGSALRSAARAAFWTITLLALPGALLSTVAWFASAPAFLAQLSPFRVQYAAIFATHAAFCLLLRRRAWAGLFAAFALLNIAAVLQGTRAFAAAPARASSTAAPVKIVFANVLSSNPDPAPLLALIAAEKPDIVALLEINARWRARLIPALSTEFPFYRIYPREDNFGLAVFARSQPGGGKVEFFADVEAPSFDFTWPRPDGLIRILVTHPLPPGDDATNTLRNQHLEDLIKWRRFVAGLATPDSPAPPVLLLGDFNATPWCPPLRRLLASAGLRPAAGDRRQLAASWPSAIPFLRIPLDHALLSPDLACASHRLGPDIGSDHFPLILEVCPSQGSR